MATARPERAPDWQTRITGRALFLTTPRQAFLQLIQRNVLGTTHVASGKLIGLAHINHHRFFAIDQLHRQR